MTYHTHLVPTLSELLELITKLPDNTELLELDRLITARFEEIDNVAPTSIGPERAIKAFVGGIVIEFWERRALRQCSAESLFATIMLLTQLGLPCERQYYKLEAIRCADDKWRCAVVFTYEGLRYIARQEARDAFASLVFVGDAFLLETGVETKLSHRPQIPQDTRIKWAYAIVRYENEGDFDMQLTHPGEIGAKLEDNLTRNQQAELRCVALMRALRSSRLAHEDDVALALYAHGKALMGWDHALGVPAFHQDAVWFSGMLAEAEQSASESKPSAAERTLPLFEEPHRPAVGAHVTFRGTANEVTHGFANQPPPVPDPTGTLQGTDATHGLEMAPSEIRSATAAGTTAEPPSAAPEPLPAPAATSAAAPAPAPAAPPTSAPAPTESAPPPATSSRRPSRRKPALAPPDPTPTGQGE